MKNVSGAGRKGYCTIRSFDLNIGKYKFDFDKAGAEFKDGVLTVVIPSREKEREKEIKKVEIK